MNEKKMKERHRFNLITGEIDTNFQGNQGVGRVNETFFSFSP